MAADRAKRVEHLTTEKQASVAPALECAGIHLLQGDATSGDLSLLVALVAGPWQDERGQRVEQRDAFTAEQFGGSPGGRDARLLE